MNDLLGLIICHPFLNAEHNQKNSNQESIDQQIFSFIFVLKLDGLSEVSLKIPKIRSFCIFTLI